MFYDGARLLTLTKHFRFATKRNATFPHASCVFLLSRKENILPIRVIVIINLFDYLFNKLFGKAVI